MAGYGELEVDEFDRWRKSGKEHVLLDVREPDEFELARIPGAVEMPMAQLRSRAAEIPHDKTVVVICHYGTRSATVAQFLAARGHDDVHNLEGGIDAYALRIDPSVGRY